MKKRKPKMTQKQMDQAMDVIMSLAYGGLIYKALKKGLVVDIHPPEDDDRLTSP